MENPYEPPQAPFSAPSSMDPFRRRSRLVVHVRVVAILMIVQAVLELLAAAGLGAMTIIFPLMFRHVQQQQEMPEGLEIWVLPLVYGGMALAALITGILHLVAGLRNYRFRGRTFGIVALVCGTLTIFTCYCLPTAAAISVYGLIVYLNRDVADAFRMGEAGQEPNEIIAIKS